MIADILPRTTSNCNGVLDTFTFTFPLLVSSDLVVAVLNTATNVSVVLEETTHYTVYDADGATGVLANFENGGYIETVSTYSAVYKITLSRAVPYTQTADFTEGMQSLYETFENVADKLTMQLQQLRDMVNRALLAPLVDPTTLDMELPNATARANRYLGFDSDGAPTVAALTTTDIGVTAFGESLMGAADSAVAVALLDLDSILPSAVQTYVDARVPAGCLMDWPTETPPDGWLERAGQSLPIADYPALYAVLGKKYGSADALHFNLPDDRGLFPRWWDHAAGVDPDAGTRTAPGATGATISAGDHVGTEQAEKTKAHSHTASGSSTTTVDSGGSHTHTIYTYSGSPNNANTVMMGQAGWGPYASAATASGGAHSHTASTATTVTVNDSTGSETRPINRAYMPIIKY